MKIIKDLALNSQIEPLRWIKGNTDGQIFSEINLGIDNSTFCSFILTLTELFNETWSKE